MCSHYQGETARKKLARMGVQLPLDWEAPPGGLHIYPTLLAPIIRRPFESELGEAAALGMEVVPARFGMLPVFAQDIQYGKHTYNARSETVSELNSFKHAWDKARHCIIPAVAIYEPDWRSGKHVYTRITRADGEALGVAGLWQPWQSPEGEWTNSFAMLTINADTHPIFRELHRPDPKRPAHMQDKRMTVILNEDDYDAWLDAPAERSMEFFRQYPAERLVTSQEPKAPTKKVSPSSRRAEAAAPPLQQTKDLF